MQAYIFRCTNATIDECFDRMLFGETKEYYKHFSDIKPGDKLFLYNSSTTELFREFIATSDCIVNIEPDAWGKKYPVQVRYKYDLKKVILLSKYISCN